MEFDRALTARLVHEPELVVAGMAAMLAPYAARVRLIGEEPGTGADLVLYDPFARHRGQPTRLVPEPGSRVVVYTWETRPGFVGRALASGVSGYVSKALPASELVTALEKVYSGEVFVALDYPHPAAAPECHAYRGTLTPRESEVVGCIASGLSNHQIADRLHLSMNTVKSHIRTAYQSMGVTSRTQALLWALEQGLAVEEDSVAPQPAPVVRQPDRAARAIQVCQQR